LQALRRLLLSESMNFRYRPSASQAAQRQFMVEADAVVQRLIGSYGANT